MPCEAHEVEAADIQEMMPPADYFDAWQKGDARSWPPPPENPEPGEPPDVELRFKVGDRVECCIARGPEGRRVRGVSGRKYAPSSSSRPRPPPCWAA